MAAAGLGLELRRGADHRTAACLLATHPDWRAAELKAALFALARPPADPDRVAIGLIPASTLANQGACSTRPPASGV